MGNLQQIRMVLGSLRYKSAPNVDFQYKLPLVQNYKLNYEFDRTSDVNLQQLYDDERQASTVFRPAGKFMLIFKNSYAGSTNYPPFENNLYYINAAEAASSQCLNGTSIAWTGLPQYNEFDFIRTDFNVSGYTQPPNNHLPVPFIAESASTYNWNHYMSYPFENQSNKQLQAVDLKTTTTLNWNAGDGIPFIVEKTQFNGRDFISFRCPVKHGLSVGEFVNLSISYNGNTLFQVDTLGLQTFDSDKFIFNIVDVGYTGTTFSNGQTGTFKRVILQTNSGDTISKYYVRRHKILTNPNDAVLVKAGFEENIFGIKKKYESSGFTPNRVARVSIKEGAQSYTLSFNRDIDLKNLLDNLGRPVTELFFTVHWKGYFGWTSGVLRQGYEFNLPPNPVTNQPLAWWASPLSSTNFTTNTWTNASGNTFSYINSLKTGDTIDGDLCEWNDFEQKERVISKLHHKFVFNPTYFPILNQTNVNNQLGYYYQPHHSIRLREYSTYIETAPNTNVEGIPNYAYFSTTLNEFIWRDIYTYGFLDPQTRIGVDYPFLNKAHYPFQNVIFRIIPEGTNYTEQIIIPEPLIDECE